MSAENKFITRWSRDFQGNLQEDPNGSWVLAADAAIRDKRLTDKIDALQALLTAADERADVLGQALKFYADRDHYSIDDGLNWDSCSGEPANILWHEDQPWFIEDGSIARAALKPAEDRNEPNCLRCLDKKTVPSNLAEGYVMDCPDC